MDTAQKIVEKTFSAADENSDGMLPVPLLTVFLREALVNSTANESQLRYALAHFARLDHLLPYGVSLKEVMLGLRAALLRARKIASNGICSMTTSGADTLRDFLGAGMVEPIAAPLCELLIIDGESSLALDEGTNEVFRFARCHRGVWAWRVGFIDDRGELVHLRSESPLATVIGICKGISKQFQVSTMGPSSV